MSHLDRSGSVRPAMPMKDAKEQLARVALLPKLFERVKRLEQNAREKGKTSSPPT